MAKGQISLIFNNKVVSKICIPNFVCGLTNKKKKRIEQTFCSVTWVIPQGGPSGHWSCPGGNLI